MASTSFLVGSIEVVPDDGNARRAGAHAFRASRIGGSRRFSP
jgi:hypothetical protein